MTKSKKCAFFAPVALLLAALTLFACLPRFISFGAEAATAAKSLKIAVMSDVHVLPPDMIKDTADYTDALNSDRKIFTESAAILDKMLSEVRAEAPDVLMIAGDLTKDGELESHEYLAARLAALKTELPALKVYVTNGNHDVNNSLAFDYNTADGVKAPATRTTPADFLDVYDGVTYSDASVVARFEPDAGKTAGMLSYVARPADGFTVIVMDTGRYSADNTDAGTDEHQTSGQISDELRAWVVAQTKSAEARGDIVVGMQHHGLVEHFDMEEELMGEYLVNDYRAISEAYADAGMRYVFTGHMHANDIASVTTAQGNKLYDVETGSAVTYPCPMRFVTLTSSVAGTEKTVAMDITTKTGLKNITYTKADKTEGVIDDLTAYAKDFGITEDMVVHLGRTLVGGLLDSYVTAAGGAQKAFEGLVSGLLGMQLDTAKIVNLLVSMLPVEPVAVASNDMAVYNDEAGNIVVHLGQNSGLYVPVKGLRESLVYLFGEIDRLLEEGDALNAAVEKFVASVINFKVAGGDTPDAADDVTLLRLANDTYQRHLSGADNTENEQYIADAVAALKDGTLLPALLKNVISGAVTLVTDLAGDVPLKEFLGIDGFSFATGETQIVALNGRTPLLREKSDEAMGINMVLILLQSEIDAEYMIKDTSKLDVLLKGLLPAVGAEKMLGELLLGAPADGDTPATEGLVTAAMQTQIADYLAAVILSMSVDTNYPEDNDTVITYKTTVAADPSDEPEPSPEPEPEPTPEPEPSGCGSLAQGGAALAVFAVIALALAAVCVVCRARREK